jgi:hypothetical protein
MIRFDEPPATGDRVIVYAPGRDFIVEGVRDPATGEFAVTALYRRVAAPHVAAEASDAPTLLLVGAEAEKTINYVETWLAERRH